MEWLKMIQNCTGRYSLHMFPGNIYRGPKRSANKTHQNVYLCVRFRKNIAILAAKNPNVCWLEVGIPTGALITILCCLKTSIFA